MAAPKKKSTSSRRDSRRPRYGNAKPETPISAKLYARNARRVEEGEESCARCGLGVKPDESQWVTFTSGGGRFLLTTDEPVPKNDPGYMGWHPIGPDCARRLKKAGVLVVAEP